MKRSIIFDTSAKESPLDDISSLRDRWYYARNIENALPAYEEIMLGSLGHLGDHIILMARKDDHWRIIRTGEKVPLWLGGNAVDIMLDRLAQDCSLALADVGHAALQSGKPYLDHFNFARDGLVQNFELFSFPMANRWGTPFVGVYVGAHGEKYSLVEAIFRSTQEGVVALAAIRDRDEHIVDFQIVDLNAGAAKLLKRPFEDLRWRRLRDGAHAFNQDFVFDKLVEVTTSNAKEVFELSISPGGETAHLNITLTAMGDLVCASMTDVTHIKRREESFLLLFENNPIPMWICEPSTRRFISVNDAAIGHYQYDRATFVGMRLDDIFPADERDDHLAAIQSLAEVYQSGRSWRHIKRDGSEIEALTFGRRIHYEGYDAYLVAVVDITERSRAERRVKQLAHRDPLTNLPNRLSFTERLNATLAGLDGEAGPTLLYLDLDSFKKVNDTEGHGVGDALLRLVAERLTAALKAGDFVARLGGDEFAVILGALPEPEAAKEIAARHIADRLVEAVSRPYFIEGKRITVGVSIGIAAAPRDGIGGDQLLAWADLALYHSKALGGGSATLFDAAMEAKALSRRLLEADLARAIADEKLRLHYQPIVDFQSRRISVFEALLRWERNGTAIPPSEFIPVAEATGLIGELGEWVLRTALRQAAGWPEAIGVSVNLSPVQFRDRSLAATVKRALRDTAVDPSRLELEITESVLLEDTEENLATLRELKAHGVRISIDDFGTGFSSLSYLRSFPFDKIKIDRSFVRDIATDASCLSIVRAIAGLGASFGVETVAEGVETGAQLAAVRQEGCRQGQGWLFGAAVGAGEIASLIAAVDGSLALAA